MHVAFTIHNNARYLCFAVEDQITVPFTVAGRNGTFYVASISAIGIDGVYAFTYGNTSKTVDGHNYDAGRRWLLVNVGPFQFGTTFNLVSLAHDSQLALTHMTIIVV